MASSACFDVNGPGLYSGIGGVSLHRPVAGFALDRLEFPDLALCQFTQSTYLPESGAMTGYAFRIRLLVFLY